MATTKKLAAVKLSTTNWTLICTATAAKNTVADVRVVNIHASTNSKVSVAIAPNSWSSGAPNDEDQVIAPKLDVLVGTAYAEDGLVLEAGEKLIAKAEDANVLCLNVRGWES